MRTSFIAILAALMVAAGLGSAERGPDPARIHELAGAREVLVKLRPGSDERRLRAVEPGLHVEPLLPHADPHFRARGLDRLFVVRADAGLSARGARRLLGDPAVESSEVSRPLVSLALPDDTFFDEQWALRNVGQMGGTPEADIAALEAWGVTRGGGVVVAVLDSGVDYDHPDLAANIWANPGEIPDNNVDDDGNGFFDDARGWDFYNGDNDPFDDGSGHGTHVAGIIAAVQDNALGISGVGPELRIMPVKIQSFEQIGRVSSAIAGIHYAVVNGASVLSNSWAVSAAWGEPGHDQPGFSPALRDAILAADDAGVLFVAAAGNSSQDLDAQVLYPASYNLPNTLTVAATDPQDQLVSWSNFGVGTVDVAAPGYSIRSTVPASCRLLGPPPTTRNCNGSGYQVASGTSMSAPHVSAVLGLMRARFPGLSHHALRARLLETGDPLPSLAGVTASGVRVNAARALGAEAEPVPATGGAGRLPGLLLLGLGLWALARALLPARRTDGDP